MVTMLGWSSPNGLDHLERGCVDPKQHRRRLCGFDGDLIVMTAERGPMHRISRDEASSDIKWVVVVSV